MHRKPFFYPADTFLTGITARFIGVVFLLTGMMMQVLKRERWAFNRLDVIFTLFLLFYGCRIFLLRPAFHWNSLLQFPLLFLGYICFRSIRCGKLFFPILYFAGLCQALWYILQVRNLLPSYHYQFIGTIRQPARNNN